MEAVLVIQNLQQQDQKHSSTHQWFKQHKQKQRQRKRQCPRVTMKEVEVAAKGDLVGVDFVVYLNDPLTINSFDQVL